MISWIILLVGAFMFFGAMLAMPLTQEGIAIGDNLTAYTANTTHWVGYSEAINFVPYLIIFLAVVIPIAAWWKAKSGGE